MGQQSRVSAACAFIQWSDGWVGSGLRVGERRGEGAGCGSHPFAALGRHTRASRATAGQGQKNRACRAQRSRARGQNFKNIEAACRAVRWTRKQAVRGREGEQRGGRHSWLVIGRHSWLVIGKQAAAPAAQQWPACPNCAAQWSPAGANPALQQPPHPRSSLCLLLLVYRWEGGGGQLMPVAPSYPCCTMPGSFSPPWYGADPRGAGGRGGHRLGSLLPLPAPASPGSAQAG